MSRKEEKNMMTAVQWQTLYALTEALKKTLEANTPSSENVEDREEHQLTEAMQRVMTDIPV